MNMNHKLGDNVIVEEKKTFNANVIYNSSEVTEDSIEKEVNRKPLGKLAKSFGQWKHCKSDHIQHFENYVKECFTEVVTQFGCCDSVVHLIPSGTQINIRASRIDGLLNPGNFHVLTPVIRRTFGLPEGSVHLNVEKCSCSTCLKCSELEC